MITPQAIETYPAPPRSPSSSSSATAFSRPKAIAFPATISASGQLLFANQSAPSGSIASQKRLIKILFHCDNSVHKYTLTLKVNGSLLFSSSDTFSRTIEVS